METRVLSNRYTIVKHLARGGMADVYEAEDNLLNRSVAVKVLHANFASDEAFVTRFRREAQAAANLSHPNIVAIYDWGKDEGTYFMVMELIRGRTLREILRTEGAILPRRAAEIASEAAAALSVAHQHGVFHRDIKPGNIMITDDGAVKVTDFGIARALDDSEELTRTGAVIGTATYFSPEQAQGLPADERSDVYSLGIVLYEMLAGKPPFTGESPVAVAYQHVSEPALPPDAVNPEVPRELAAVVEHAIQKNPDDRYQSADALRTDLQRYLSGSEPVAAAAVMAAAPTAVIASPPGPAPTGYVTAETTAVEPAPEARSQTSYWVAVGALVAVLIVAVFLLFQLLSGGEEAAATVEVPDLRGVPAEQAFATLQDLDLKVRSINEASEEVPIGLVIRTDPGAGQTAPVGSFVDVYVSAGEEEVGVPNLIGENVDVARARIEADGFTVGAIEYKFTEDVDENIVTDQNPAGGTTAPTGTPVNLIVSSGPSSIEVPDVSGKTADTAVLELTRAGFTSIETEEDFSPDVLEGFVIETNPAAGQVVPRDATIVVVVSQGPEPVEVPSLIGSSVASAEQQLNELGLLLVVSSQTVEVSLDSGLIGNVADQSPSSGTTVEVGSEVTVRIGAPTQVTVPDLRGLTAEEAQTEAGSVGLNVDIVGTTVTNDQAQKDLVADQDPAPGTTVDEGSFIDVTVFVYEPIVPNLDGLTLAQAQTELDDVGLGTVAVANQVETADGNLVGTVVPGSQNPAAGTAVAEGTNVTVDVYIAQP
ncbi:MAG: Stk1 family PASTA domain-containing Ser/Thr kinase [Acidimicrobiia bacterium]|nr:Stk1 family PASTA domain-containing Ser/Thr kinase [Acidimicrobiia bacterium]